MLPIMKQINLSACCVPARMLPWRAPLSPNIQSDGWRKKKLSLNNFFSLRHSLTKFAVTLDVNDNTG